jgi:tRNA uridine 5-carboxymethylaminomethyl modification enzyme
MFTSRAEYRLTLRQDNADLRLSDVGYEIGLLESRHYQALCAKRTAVNDELHRLRGTRSGKDTLEQMLRRPEQTYGELPGRREDLAEDVIQQVEIAVKYAGYIERQEIDIERFKTLEDKQIPESLDYAAVPSLRMEARQKLSHLRPVTVGQASRISGVSPSDISILLVHMKHRANPKLINSDKTAC